MCRKRVPCPHGRSRLNQWGQCLDCAKERARESRRKRQEAAGITPIKITTAGRKSNVVVKAPAGWECPRCGKATPPGEWHCSAQCFADTVEICAPFIREVWKFKIGQLETRNL